jgi:peroxiredoxin
MTVRVGSRAPGVPGVSQAGPHALLFYKVTCGTCQMAAPVLDRFRAYADRVVGVGQDPSEKLEAFAATYSMTLPSHPDLPPYAASGAYGVEHVPTMFVVDAGGRVADVVESWDREGYNRASRTLAGLLGAEPVVISASSDGLPEFRPG